MFFKKIILLICVIAYVASFFMPVYESVNIHFGGKVNYLYGYECFVYSLFISLAAIWQNEFLEAIRFFFLFSINPLIIYSIYLCFLEKNSFKLCVVTTAVNILIVFFIPPLLYDIGLLFKPAICIWCLSMLYIIYFMRNQIVQFNLNSDYEK